MWLKRLVLGLFKSKRGEEEIPKDLLRAINEIPKIEDRIEPFIIYVNDEENDEEIEIVLVCGCEWPVEKMTEDYFRCRHCDTACIKQDCDRCKYLSINIDFRTG